ncbi:MAG: AmmeMemoRadiSam system protein B [Candidatus Aminicenantes bacterium]|nr:AmmeMemoRadiSam system protein B [Candidatus Aminicenantes bacterium]
MTENPLSLKLRPGLEIQPINYKGQPGLLISDRLGLIENPVILQGEALEVLALIDGRREAEDIQLEFLRRKGYSLEGAGLVSKILEEFRRLLIIDSLEYRERKQKLIQEFFESPIRPAVLAGEAYPGKEEELRAFIKNILGLEVISGTEERKEEIGEGREKNIKALVSPHIDLRVGSRIYSLAYRQLTGCSYERVIILGTGHFLEDGIFSLTEKDYSTPLGRVRTDKKIVRKLKEAGGELVAAHDLAHKKEHSIEFQLIFLQHLLGDNFELIPILCGSFHQWLTKASRASEIPGIEPFLSALKELASAREKRTLIVAGVDLSHIGPKFGHRQRAAELKKATLAFDDKIIEALLRLDAVTFWRLLQETWDSFNVCGFPALATLLEIMPAEKGYFLGYDLAEEPATQSAVSFMALAFS